MSSRFRLFVVLLTIYVTSRVNILKCKSFLARYCCNFPRPCSVINFYANNVLLVDNFPINPLTRFTILICHFEDNPRNIDTNESKTRPNSSFRTKPALVPNTVIHPIFNFIWISFSLFCSSRKQRMDVHARRIRTVLM